MKFSLAPKIGGKTSLEKGKTRMKLSLAPKLVEKLVWKKERQDETQFTTKNWWKN
jgi:outer membrane phospholipase A